MEDEYKGRVCKDLEEGCNDVFEGIILFRYSLGGAEENDETPQSEFELDSFLMKEKPVGATLTCWLESFYNGFVSEYLFYFTFRCDIAIFIAVICAYYTLN